MKVIQFIFCITITYCLVACGGDAFFSDEEEEELMEENVYPRKYVYQGVAFNPTEFYRYKGATEFEQFTPQTGVLLLADSTIEDEYIREDGPGMLALQEVELLSDTLIRLLIVEDESTIGIDSAFQYTLEENKLIIDVFGSTIELTHDEEEKELKLCNQYYIYNYFSTIINEREFSPLFGRACFGDSMQEVLEKIIQVEVDIGVSFQLDDTVVVNVSNYIMELEE